MVPFSGGYLGFFGRELSSAEVKVPSLDGVNFLITRKLRRKRGSIPIPSVHDILAYISQKNPPNVGIYTIHGWYGICFNNLIVGVYVPIIRIPHYR